MHYATINKLEEELSSARGEMEKIKAQIHPPVFFTLGSTPDASGQASLMLAEEVAEAVSASVMEPVASPKTVDSNAVVFLSRRKLNALYSQALHETRLQELKNEHAEVVERLHEHLTAKDEKVSFHSFLKRTSLPSLDS